MGLISSLPLVGPLFPVQERIIPLSSHAGSDCHFEYPLDLRAQGAELRGFGGEGHDKNLVHFFFLLMFFVFLLQNELNFLSLSLAFPYFPPSSFLAKFSSVLKHTGIYNQHLHYKHTLCKGHG